MAEYFELLANLNHIMAISNTLIEKIDEDPFHKYIAHQLALLYVRKMNLCLVQYSFS